MGPDHSGDAARLRILVVDDDAGVRRLLRTMLEEEGFEVREARDGKEALGVLDRERMALVTLDLGLGGDDGLAVAREIRRLSDTPVIMVTAKSSEIDRIVGLEIGADDYIVKPFNSREALARIRAVLRRSQPAAADTRLHPKFAFAEYEFDVAARSLSRRDGRSIDLTSREHALLEAFVRRPRRVLSRNALLDLVGGDGSDYLDRAIDTLISRLRRKIESDPAHPVLIKTVRGAGYMFTAAVSAI